MMCHRLLLGLVAVWLLLPALLTASERKYPPEMPATADGKPLAFIKDLEGNAVDGSWEHLERARERCLEKGTIDVEALLYHAEFERLQRSVMEFEGRRDDAAPREICHQESLKRCWMHSSRVLSQWDLMPTY